MSLKNSGLLIGIKTPEKRLIRQEKNLTIQILD
jgi:hypothetical protein